MRCAGAWQAEPSTLMWAVMCLCLSGMWSFSVSELAIPGAEIGRISATDADLGENARLEYTILEGETGDTFNISGINQEAIITLNKVRKRRGEGRGDTGCLTDNFCLWVKALHSKANMLPKPEHLELPADTHTLTHGSLDRHFSSSIFISPFLRLTLLRWVFWWAFDKWISSLVSIFPSVQSKHNETSALCSAKAWRIQNANCLLSLGVICHKKCFDQSWGLWLSHPLPQVFFTATDWINEPLPLFP